MKSDEAREFIQSLALASLGWRYPAKNMKLLRDGTPWLWTLDFGHHEDRTPTHGYEPTREAAMAAFAKSWRRPALKKSVPGEDRMNWIWTLLWLLLIAVVGVVVRPFWDEYSFQILTIVVFLNAIATINLWQKAARRPEKL